MKLVTSLLLPMCISAVCYSPLANAQAEATTTTIAPTTPASDAKDVMQMSLEELMNVKVYSVSKKEQKISDAPQVVTIITPDDLRKFGLKTIHDALSLVPGFDIQRLLRKEYHWTRGNRGTALILVDGTAVLNAADNEAFLDEAFQIENIKQVEVLRGPGGVVWGSNAFLGIVNIITRDPAKSPFVEVNSAIGSFESKRLGVATSQNVGDLGIFFSAKTLDTKKHVVQTQFQKTDGPNPPSYYNDYFVKLKYKDWTASYRNDKHLEYSPITDTAGGTGAGTYPKDYPAWETDPIELAQIKYDGKLSENLESHSKIAYLKRNTSLFIPTDRNSASFYVFDTLQTDRYILDLQFNHRIAQNDDLVYGASYDRAVGYHNVIKDETGTITDPAIANVRMNAYGAYAQWTHDFSKSFTAGAGIRGEYIDQQNEITYNGGYKQQTVKPQYLFNLNSVYKFDRGDTFKLIAGRGVRRPTFEQSSSAAGNFTGSDVTEEQVYSYEADYVWKINNELSWQNNYSYNDIYGLIDFINSGTGKFTATNLPHAYIHVYESELRRRMSDGSYGMINLTYKDGKTMDGQTFSIDNTNKFNANLAYSQRIKDGVFFSNIIRFVGEKQDNHQEDDGTAPVANPPQKTVPSWTTWDTGIVWDNLYIKNLDFSFFVYNALGSKYYMQNRITKKSYMNEQPGRNFTANVAYKF